MIPHYRIDGAEGAPTIVLANSLGTDLSMWDAQIPALKEHFRIVRYDKRGHGRTPATPGPYDLALLGNDVLSLLDDLGVQRAHFAGVSLGGMIGMWLAEHAPDRIDRLALVCTSAALPPEPWRERAALVREKGTEVLAESSLGRWFTPGFGQRADIVAKYQAMIKACDDEGYASCCEAIASMSLLDELSGITADTLVIAGRDDPAIPPPHGERIAENVSARLEVLDDAAHLPNVERFDVVNNLFRNHFAGVDDD